MKYSKLEPENVLLSDLESIGELFKCSMSQLRKKNRYLERAYNGPGLTKAQLVYQVAFLRDAPAVREREVKYGKDHSEKITVDKICQGLRKLIDKGASNDKLCDYIDNKFIDGAWGYYSFPYDFLKDIRGLLIEMYKGAK